MKFLRSLAGSRRTQRTAASRSQLSADGWPTAIYAIGDIHGCADQLTALHAIIDSDSRQFDGEKWLVYLGDYVDRGPHSAQVLDQLIAPPPQGWRRIALPGNHEIMMLDFLATPRKDHGWLRFGGVETLASYGVDARDLLALPERQRLDRLRACIPEEHLDFLRRLPVTLSVPGVVFVHAGLRPGVALADQREDDLLWIRNEFLDAAPEPGRLVVHGHTPRPAPVVAPGRICVDTGAFATGILTAVCLTERAAPRFLNSGSTAKVTLAN